MKQKKPTAKPTDETIKLKNPHFSGKCDEIKVVSIQDSGGIKAEWCSEKGQAVYYLFDSTKWTRAEAKEWVRENAKDSDIEQFKGEQEELDEELDKIFTTAQVSRKEGKLLAIASEAVEDREGDVINVEGWDLKNFKNNPVLLWMHNKNFAHNGLPIGSVKSIGIKTIDGEKKLVFEPEFDDSTEFNRTVKKFFEDGTLNAFSVGFLPTEREGNEFLKQELLEISGVPVPALASALVLQRAKALGISRSKALEIVEVKGAVRFKSFELASMSRAWDSTASEQRLRSFAGGPDKDTIRWSEYRDAFTWYDEDNFTDFGGYKLPHHDVVGDEVVTVWRGVVSAMGALLGARGGVDIPQEDMRRVYNHLAKHYEEFDKEPPEFRHVQDQTLKHLFEFVEEQLKEEYEKRTERHIQTIVSEIRRHYRDKRKQVDSKEKVNDVNVLNALKLVNTMTSKALEEANLVKASSEKPKKKEVNKNE